MPCDIDTLQTEACDSGIGKLTDLVQLLQIIAQLMCDVSTAGSGSGQIKIYTSDPNAEGVVPDDLTSPAIAYTEGVGATYVWSISGQEWI